MFILAWELNPERMTRAEPMATETTFHRYLIYIIYLDVQDDMRHIFTIIVKYAYQFLPLNYLTTLASFRTD